MVHVLGTLHSRVGNKVWETNLTLSLFLCKCRNADFPKILVSRFPTLQWAFKFIRLRLYRKLRSGAVWSRQEGLNLGSCGVKYRFFLLYLGWWSCVCPSDSLSAKV